MKVFTALFASLHTVAALNIMVPQVFSVHRQGQLPVSTTSLNMYASTKEAIAEAQRICSVNPSSKECKVAWDIVEELEAADSHRINADLQNLPQEGNTNMSPDLLALVNSFDILAGKITGKMDHLKATTDKLQELGADDPAVAELGARAEDMKQVLAYVNDYLRRQV